jgi:hypothetical protein
MPIEVLCPKCSGILKAPSALAGKEALCPACRGVVRVPLQQDEILDAELEEPAANGQVNASVGSGSLHTEANRDDRGSAQATANEPAGEERRPCPACGEAIIATAAKCRWCGEVFDPSLLRGLGGTRTVSPGLARQFHNEMRLLGGMWIIASVLSTLVQIAVLLGQGIHLQSETDVRGPFIAGMIIGVSMVYSLPFAMGWLIATKQVWAVWAQLILSYLLGLILALMVVEFCRPGFQAAGPMIFAVGALACVVCGGLFWGHRCISAAGQLRRAGISTKNY